MNLPGYHDFWSYAQRKGYSGTAVFSKEEPLRVVHGLGIPELDTEGRIVALEFPSFWFVNVYTPNAQNELARIDHRMSWDDSFRNFCKNLEVGILPETGGLPAASTLPEADTLPEVDTVSEESLVETIAAPAEIKKHAGAKPVVMCGDFNVAHEEIDLKNPGSNRGNAGFSDEERGKFTSLINAGFTDTFRTLYPSLEGAYSWWSYRGQARARNTGWRIDYFLVSNSLAKNVTSASIYSGVLGSDHCPVGLEIEIGKG